MPFDRVFLILGGFTSRTFFVRTFFTAPVEPKSHRAATEADIESPFDEKEFLQLIDFLFAFVFKQCHGERHDRGRAGEVVSDSFRIIPATLVPEAKG